MKANYFSFFISSIMAQSTVYSGQGFGTYYYDTTQVQACGADFSSQNQGVVRCSSTAGGTLDNINSNYIVAMNNTQLGENLEAYCVVKRSL